MEINYETLLQEVLAMWPEKIVWQKSEDPLAARYIVAFEVVFDSVEEVIAKESDEILLNMKRCINWAVSTAFHFVLVDVQIEQQGKLNGTLYKTDLPLDRVKRKFISDVFDEQPDIFSWAVYLREHNVEITGLD